MQYANSNPSTIRRQFSRPSLIDPNALSTPVDSQLTNPGWLDGLYVLTQELCPNLKPESTFCANLSTSQVVRHHTSSNSVQKTARLRSRLGSPSLTP